MIITATNGLSRPASATAPGRPATAPRGWSKQLGTGRRRTQTINGRATIGPATVNWGVATHVGTARTLNQDAYGAHPPVFVVADGMGGHAAGEVASWAVVDALQNLAGGVHVTPQMVVTSVADARASLAGIPVHGGRPPGTTLSGVIVTSAGDHTPCWMVVNIGDSRTYRLDSRGFSQLSADHTIAARLIAMGAVTASDARRLRHANVLTKAIEAESEHSPDVRLLPMRRRDRILVCSDGLTGVLNEATIAGVLRRIGDPLKAANELVNAVLAAGGQDDVTVLVVDAVAIGFA